MARYAKIGFSPMELRAGGVTSNAGSAAGAVSVGDLYGAQAGSSPDWGKFTEAQMTAKAEQNIAQTLADAQVEATQIGADSQVKVAKLQSKALESQASSAKSSGIMSGIGSVAGAALGLLSDEETKHTVDQIDDALETLRNLRPVTFFYKEEYSSSPERMHHGFIAQEFQKVLPDATYFDESFGKLTIDTSDVIGLLVRANQELEERIGMLEAKQALATV